MGAIPFPLINGVLYDYSCIEAVLGPAGRVSVAMKSIDYARKRDRDKPHGAHPDPLGKTPGQNSYTGSCELYLPMWQVTQAQLGPGYGDLLFPVFVTYNAFGLPPITDELLGCSIDETSIANAQSKNALFVKINLDPIKVLFNGEDDVLIPLIASSF